MIDIGREHRLAAFAVFVVVKMSRRQYLLVMDDFMSDGL